MLIAGLDLSAEPKGTALAVLEVSSTGVKLQSLELGLLDSQIVAASAQVQKLGIDCALGWPIEFIDFLQQQANPNMQAQKFEGSIELRRTLAYRETDRMVREVTKRWPLSVSTDRLGMAAIRCAGLLSAIAATGANASRAGDGLVVEVYPAASMRIWQLDSAGYRNDADVRARLLRDLCAAAPWLEVAGHEPLLIASHDAFDSLIAALATLAVVVGHATALAENMRERARVEGWVHLPTVSLAEVFAAASLK
jgi:hypothetical protein